MQFQGRNFSWKAVAGVLGTAALSLLPAIHTKSLAGTSEILTIAYLSVWAVVLSRTALHLYEGYLWCGLWRETLLELLTVVAWGALGLKVASLPNPQIVVLAASAIVVSLLLFASATVLERAREQLAAGEHGVRLRRATEVVKESWLWTEACDLFSRLDTRPTEKLREWISGEESKDGFLSRTGIFALSAVAALAITACSLIIVGTVLGTQLTAHSAKAKNFGEGGQSKQGSRGTKGGESQEAEGSSEASAPTQAEHIEPVIAKSDSDCAITYDPGRRVPEPQRSTLMLAWHEVDGIEPGPLEALGSDIGGCPGRAWPIPGSPDWWYAAGYCEGNLRAIAIAPAGIEHPVVMLEQAAVFALPLIRHEEFRDAIDRFTVGDGDAYVINTTTGSYVLIRVRSTDGSTGSDGSRGCNDFANRDVAYTTVPPALIPGWRSIAAISNGGVYPVGVTHGDPNLTSFQFVSGAGIEAEGRCWHEATTCGVKIEGHWIRSGPARTNQEEIEALAEPGP